MGYKDSTKYTRGPHCTDLGSCTPVGSTVPLHAVLSSGRQHHRNNCRGSVGLWKPSISIAKSSSTPPPSGTVEQGVTCSALKGARSKLYTTATVNQHPSAHHPLDARYYSVVDETQLELIFGFTLLTNSVENRSLLWVDW
jgi:hypothetical protein